MSSGFRRAAALAGLVALSIGGRLLLSGRAAAGELLTIRAGGRVLGRTTTGPRGGFRLAVRAPARKGGYGLVLQGQGRRAHAGTLRVRPLVLAAVGDVNLGDRTATAIAAHGADYPWTGVGPLLRSADLAVANLECAVSRRGLAIADKEHTFRGSPAALPGLARAGLDAVTVANNHSLDFGRDAFLETVAGARRAGLAVVGGGADLGAARRPAIFTAGGLRSRCSATRTSARSASTPARASPARLPPTARQRQWRRLRSQRAPRSCWAPVRTCSSRCSGPAHGRSWPGAWATSSFRPAR
jgi:hypothetical protein